jgi:hypothetical protein
LIGLPREADELDAVERVLARADLALPGQQISPASLVDGIVNGDDGRHVGGARVILLAFHGGVELRRRWVDPVGGIGLWRLWIGLIAHRVAQARDRGYRAIL